MSQSKKFNLSSFIVITSGIISICIGILVILGWHLHITQLIQIKSSFAPMQYNTACSFILLGFSLLLIFNNLPNLSMTCSSIVGIISFFTLLEHLLNINLSIDEFLFKPYITIQTPYPGRMAINTAFCFLFLSCGLIIICIKDWIRNAHILLSIIISIPLAISSIALLGYLTNLQSIYSWKESLGMAIHTAGTLTTSSLGLFALTLKQSPKTIQNTLLNWLPIPIITCATTVNIVLWLAISSSSTKHPIVATIILITGIVVSLLLGYIVHLLQKERRHSLESKELSKKLQNQISEREKIEHAISRINKKLQSILVHANNAIVSINRNSILTLWNPAAEQMFGWTKDEALGKSMVDMIIPPQYRDRHNKGMEHLLKTGKAPLMGKTIEIIAQRKNEEIFPIELSLFQSEFGENSEYTAIMRDISERKKTEDELKKAYQELKETQDQLLQAAKLASMGELAAGIAHELTQPLQGIKGFSETIRIDLSKILGEDKLSENEVKKYALRNANDIEIILQQTNRMSTILNGIRDFARSSNLEKEQVNINEIIEASLILFIDNFKTQNISLNKELSKELPDILGNKNQLQQVFINLISNSFDAMEQTQNKKELSIYSKLSSDKNYVTIEMRDSGIGIDEETQKKIFNPFFTTKKEGTGLGMSISDRIIRDHNAYITIQSKINSGTTFTISFPIPDKSI